MIEVCFVCTGNTCRSVMAERIAKKLAKIKNIKDVKFSSAGLNAKGDNITENASKTLKMLGYDGRNRKSVKLKKIKDGCIYVAVTKEHKKYIPSKKVIAFDELYQAVDDPYGKDLNCYVQTAQKIEKNIEVLLKKIEVLRGEL